MKKALIISLVLVMLLFACTASFAENATTSNAVELTVADEDEIDFDKTYGDLQTVYGVYDPLKTSWKIQRERRSDHGSRISAGRLALPDCMLSGRSIDRLSPDFSKGVLDEPADADEGNRAVR